MDTTTPIIHEWITEFETGNSYSILAKISERPYLVKMNNQDYKLLVKDAKLTINDEMRAKQLDAYTPAKYYPIKTIYYSR